MHCVITEYSTEFNLTLFNLIGLAGRIHVFIMILMLCFRMNVYVIVLTEPCARPDGRVARKRLSLSRRCGLRASCASVCFAMGHTHTNWYTPWARLDWYTERNVGTPAEWTIIQWMDVCIGMAIGNSIVTDHRVQFLCVRAGGIQC